jgi:hypothetical protein
VAKLSKAQAKAHQQACDLLAKDRLTEDDKWFVLENWQESATHINTIAGAFFTPVGLARDFSIEVGGGRIIDLCAGIGALSFMCSQGYERPSHITCIEFNPDYAAVGRKILPEAEWIIASVFDLPKLGHFDFAIGNPPFGATPKGGKAPRYTGGEFEYHVIDIASDLADWGVFILPQMSAPFRYSGQQCFEVRESDRYLTFKSQTGIELGPNCGIDTDCYRRDWHGVSVATEIVVSDFVEARATRRPAQTDLFEEAA